MALADKKINEITELETIRGFLFIAQEGLCTKGDIAEKLERIDENIDRLEKEITKGQQALAKMDAVFESEDVAEAKSLADEFGTPDQLTSRISAAQHELEEWNDLKQKLAEIFEVRKNFNKTLCFSNIRELLKQNPDVKIGQIEKEAGIRLGYMSRLEKGDNTAEPSMEFILTAAKLLKVSLDTLVSVNLAGLTPTEQYIVSFFDKLKADTLADKLDWNRESEHFLNNLESDINGDVWHPLFSVETFYEEGETEYPEQVTRIVFSSKTFGPRTYINDDCFNLRLKNGTTLYLMSIEKSVHKVADPNAKAIEAWMSVPYKGSQLLVASQDDTPVASMVVELYDTVKARMEHPKINKDAMYAINAFMNDDLSDDDDELPFN